MRICLAAAALLLTSITSSSAEGEKEGRFYSGDSGPHDCISNEDRLRLARESAAYEAAHAEQFAELRARRSRSVSGSSYSFFPQAGRMWDDLFIGNFVDLDSTTATLDYACGTATYDGHRGIDCSITSFGKQEIGVPIYAVADGIVTAAHDGEADQNTEWNGQPANYVVVSHADGRRTYYYHMKKDSVAVSVGQEVVAGQQLGLTGSSGISTGPHLHFETRDSNVVMEPFAGDCRMGATIWEAQPDYFTALNASEFTVTFDDLGQWAGAPLETSRTGYVELGQQRVFFWVKLQNTAAENLRNTRFLRPDGSVAYNLGTRTFTGPQRRSTRWYNYLINFDVPGEWTIEFTVNDLVINAPLTMVPVGAPRPNRDPYPITVAMNPAVPEPDDVVAVEVTNWDVIDDPDYDLLRYRYVWKQNDTVVRDVTTAALSDYLPRTFAASGVTLSCEVTVTDGQGGSAPVAMAVGAVSGGSSVGAWWGY